MDVLRARSFDLPNTSPLTDGGGPIRARSEVSESQGSDRLWSDFANATPTPLDASISGFWTDQQNGSGVVKFRWRQPGDAITFRMNVDVKSGDPKMVIAEVWTNANNNHDPDNGFYAVRMNPSI